MAENVTVAVGPAERLVETISRQQDELNYVARVLHEQVGQVLTVVGLQLDLLRQDFGDSVSGLGQRAVEIQSLLEQAIDDVRQLSYRLNPDVVQRSGLRYAMDMLIGKFRESSRATIRLLSDSHVHLPLPVASAIYQIVEQALENAVRHSQATLIEVVLQPVQDGIRLEVRDNGCGFDLDLLPQPGLGLLWMRHLAARNEIAWRIESAPGKGTVVQAVHKSQESTDSASPAQ